MFASAQQSPSRRGVQRRTNVKIVPEIPDAQRVPELVFLEHADELLRHENEPYMILVGNVEFSKGGMRMYTDSAHYYDATGSFDAFGNVRMEQGDTLFIYGDELNYDGLAEIANLFGYDGKPVRLINRDVKLETDIFTYDMRQDLGYYQTGGVLTDRDNRLESIEGEYNPTTKEANFYRHVVLTSQRPDDELILRNEELYYNTVTHLAEFHVPTVITNKDGRIDSDEGVYNTETGVAELYEHSLVTTNRGTILEGDTLFYDRATGIGEAWGNMAILDTVKSSKLVGDYGFYNDIIDSAFVTGHAVAMEFSDGDTLYIHGKYLTSVLRLDTLSRVIGVDTVYIEDLPDSILSDSLLSNPGEDSLTQVFQPADSVRLQMLSEASLSQSVLNNDSIAELIKDSVAGQAVIDDSLAEDLLSEDFVVLETLQEDSLTQDFLYQESLHGIDSLNGSLTHFPEDLTEVVDSVVTPKFRLVERTEEYVDSTHVISAWPRVRMYRADIQGLCDSLVFTQVDSMVRMYHHPVVWSEDRQIFGNLIELHLNDSTVESATLPDFGFMAQFIEDQFYNQITGKSLKAWFNDGQLYRTLVEGSVEGIVYPEENDSTINKLVNFKSANLDGYYEGQVMKRMKLWSQTTGEAIPLYLAKYTDLHLPQFVWYSDMRPSSPSDIFVIPAEMEALMSDRPLPADMFVPRAPDVENNIMPEDVASEPSTSPAESVVTPEEIVPKNSLTPPETEKEELSEEKDEEESSDESGKEGVVVADPEISPAD